MASWDPPRHKPVVAAFDFDETLTTRHSLPPFIRQVAGLRRLATGAVRSAPWLIGALLGVVDRGTAKARFLRSTIGGMTREALDAKARAFAEKRLPRMLRADMVARVKEHRRRGHAVVLVTASLELYLSPWAGREGFDAVLATELDFRNERFAGRLATPNCWGKEKAMPLQERLSTRPPSVLYVYGDSRGDREVLAMADRKWKRGDGRLPTLEEPREPSPR